VRGLRPLAFNDLWLFSIEGNAWRRLDPAVGAPSPSPRSHLSLVALSPSTLMLYGGALCIPGCSCHGDTWTYNIAGNQWTQLNATDAPIHRYRQRLVVHGKEGAAYLCGGESYQPYMYHNAINRLELPPAIAQEMMAFAGGGGKRHGRGAAGTGGGRAAAMQFVGGRKTAEMVEPALTTQVITQGVQFPSYAPFVLLAVGLAGWGFRARRQRAPHHAHGYTSVPPVA